MWKKYKNWVKLIKWINNHRKVDNCAFDVITTSTEIIIYLDKRVKTNETTESETLRLNY